MDIDQFYAKYAKELGLELVCGSEGVCRALHCSEAERPGLSLLGYSAGFSKKSAVIFGKAELAFLSDLRSKERVESLKLIAGPSRSFFVLCNRLNPLPEMLKLCEEKKIPLFRSSMQLDPLIRRLNALIAEEGIPSLSCHGSFLDIFGIGVLIQGDSAIGKSEAALGLIERGHRLISDDIVKIKKKEEGLEGCGVDLSRHHLEVRGIGIINVARLHGLMRVNEKKILDIVVKLEVWNDSDFCDRREHKESSTTFLGIDIPYYLLPVKPGRDIVLLLETIALNHRFKILSALESKGKQRPWENTN